MLLNPKTELAASFRDKEKELQPFLNLAKRNWERQMQQHREIVNEEKVAEVVAMMTGVPVQRIAQAEGNKLLAMSGELKREIIGQDDAVDKIVKAIRLMFRLAIRGNLSALSCF